MHEQVALARVPSPVCRAPYRLPWKRYRFQPSAMQQETSTTPWGSLHPEFRRGARSPFRQPDYKSPSVSLFLPPALSASHASFPPFPLAMLLFLSCSNPLRVYSTNKSSNKSIYPFPLSFSLSLDCSFRKLLEHRANCICKQPLDSLIVDDGFANLPNYNCIIAAERVSALCVYN